MPPRAPPPSLLKHRQLKLLSLRVASAPLELSPLVLPLQVLPRALPPVSLDSVVARALLSLLAASAVPVVRAWAASVVRVWEVSSQVLPGPLGLSPLVLPLRALLVLSLLPPLHSAVRRELLLPVASVDSPAARLLPAVSRRCAVPKCGRLIAV